MKNVNGMCGEWWAYFSEFDMCVLVYGQISNINKKNVVQMFRLMRWFKGFEEVCEININHIRTCESAQLSTTFDEFDIHVELFVWVKFNFKLLNRPINNFVDLKNIRKMSFCGSSTIVAQSEAKN